MKRAVDEMSDIERRNEFMAAWDKHRKSGFAPTQKEADALAKMWKIKAPKLDQHATTVKDALAAQLGEFRRVLEEREAEEKALWTPGGSFRWFPMATSPSGQMNYSQLVPKNDGTATAFVDFVTVNMSPFDIRVTKFKFNWLAMKDSCQVSGKYNEACDLTVSKRSIHKVTLELEGKIANPSGLVKDSIQIIHFFPRDGVATISGHWDVSESLAHLMPSAVPILVSWGAYV